MATGGRIDAGLVLFARFGVDNISIVSGNALVDECKGGGFPVDFVDV